MGARGRRSVQRLSLFHVYVATAWAQRDASLLSKPSLPSAARDVAWTSPLTIRLYPDPCLRARNLRVEGPFTENLSALARAMLDLMYATEGCGLAAPQVREAQRLMLGGHTRVRWRRDRDGGGGGKGHARPSLVTPLGDRYPSASSPMEALE